MYHSKITLHRQLVFRVSTPLTLRFKDYIYTEKGRHTRTVQSTGRTQNTQEDSNDRFMSLKESIVSPLKISFDFYVLLWNISSRSLCDAVIIYTYIILFWKSIYQTRCTFSLYQKVLKLYHQEGVYPRVPVTSDPFRDESDGTREVSFRT